MIGILDLDMCNIRSVSKAIWSLGQEFTLVREAGDLERPTHLIIPGVGSYGEAMRIISGRGLTEPIRRFALERRPLLGICLGMQLLSDSSEEGAGAAGRTRGLGLVPGHVVRFEGGPDHPVPHVGWNNVSYRFPHPILKGVKNSVDFYFVHSYFFRSESPEFVLGETDYGPMFTSAVASGSVAGVQFHPEKSQSNGMKLLENFCRWDGRC